MKEITSNYYTLYKTNKLPECFIPQKPFYDICKKGWENLRNPKVHNKIKANCVYCIIKYDFDREL